MTLPPDDDGQILGTVTHFKPPVLGRVRRGWNEIMLMILSTAATGGTVGAIGICVWWLLGLATGRE